VQALPPEQQLEACGEHLRRRLVARRGPNARARALVAARVEEVLGTVGLSARAHHLAGTLSHGEKQWLELGMLMAQDPELLLVDEPVAGMTDEETERTAELLRSVAQDRAVLVIEHDMELVFRFARRITVLVQGTVLVEGAPAEIAADPRVQEVYLGEERALWPAPAA
jgi:urea transport system ATP-binding protein